LRGGGCHGELLAAEYAKPPTRLWATCHHPDSARYERRQLKSSIFLQIIYYDMFSGGTTMFTPMKRKLALIK
jgi:hypothetical protein